MRSIRRRTLGLVLLVFGVSMFIIGFISYRFAAQEIEELHDRSLAQNARLLEGLLQAPLPAQDRTLLLRSLESALLQPGATEPPDLSDGYTHQLAFQLWEGNQLLLRSDNAPATPLVSHPAGYSTATLGEQTWRVYVLSMPDANKRVIVSERQDVRAALTREVALRTLLPDLIGLPLLTLLLWWSIGWGLAPLSRMAEQIRSRDPNNLQPLSLQRLPQELDTIAGALNRLLARLQQMRIREKRFIADATHELRTPLAILDLHAQNALTADNRADREESLHHLRSGVARSTRLVAQLLTLARLDPEEEPLPEIRHADVRQETQETLAKLLPLATERRQQLHMEVEEQQSWLMEEEPGAIETLVQNLVGNALQHSPPEGAVTVHLSASRHHITLMVDDQGKGIPPSERSRVVERFQRAGPGAGAGLGLSIVERIVKRHGGTLLLEDAPSGGLRVHATLARDSLTQRHAKE